jgi:peptidoglycan hydrolase-like protein with peptidoglycan-binding domain
MSRQFWEPERETNDRVIHPLPALVFVIVVILFMFFVVGQAEAAGRGDTGADVVAIQEDLRALGYTGVRADGVYGPRTERAVRHFQRANGLRVDGEAGPVTAARLDKAASGNAPAVRGQQTPVQAPAAVSPPSSWSGPCAEWHDEMQFFGLPQAMTNIMFRESRCRPDVTSNTGCCHGLLQVHRIHLPKPECQAYSEADLFDPAKNLCVASILFKRSGMAPWRL